MELNLYWTMGPVLTAVLLWLYMAKRGKRAAQDIEAGIRAPSSVERIIGISPPSLGTPKGLYAVYFSSSGPSVPFYLDALDIVDRCTTHSLPIPYCVASDAKVPSDRVLHLDDRLLMQAPPRRTRA
jgi:hypothetical protein